MGNININIRTTPECEKFLKIKWNDDDYITIEEFIKIHQNATKSEIENCYIKYREVKKKYSDFLVDYSSRATKMQQISFNSCMLTKDAEIKASMKFIKKAIQELQAARFFTMKSFLILDSNENIPWVNGYGTQYLLRCTYFETASIWYISTIDHILQAVYWAYKLYTSAKENGKPFNQDWTYSKIASKCNGTFVTKELQSRKLTDIENSIANCLEKTKEIRKWANDVKHKGGIEQKYLEADDPIHLLIQNYPSLKDVFTDIEKLDNEFNALDVVEIDKDVIKLEQAYQDIFNCITDVIQLINYEQYKYTGSET